jgi:predicted transcriptional regulator
MASLLERYDKDIAGVLSCYDRVVIHGSLPGIGHSEGMTAYLNAHNIRIFDYTKEFAEPLRELIRSNAERLAEENGIEIQFLRKGNIRKESFVEKILAERGRQPGMVAILSAMEACPAYKPWHDKKTHRTYVRPDTGKCLHYYFYFIDAKYGLCYLRVPTWCPFRLQFYFNGHNRLAAALDKAGVDYRLEDNAFTRIDDFNKAQKLADAFDVRELHHLLDRYARKLCPVVRKLGMTYHWSLMQVEYATDIVFRSREALAPLYETIVRTAIHAVKPEKVATFLGRRLTASFNAELGNNFNTRIEGTRIRHQMGSASIKMYDKFGLVLRIETTTNDVSFFKLHRTVEHRDGSTEFKPAPLKKNIYSLSDLRRILAASNRRYLEFISAIDDPSAGTKLLDKISRPVQDEGRNYKGFNFFSFDDLAIMLAIARGEHAISGFRNADLRHRLAGFSSSQISRQLKRLRLHGLIKRTASRYKYYLTSLGRRAVLTGLKLRELFVIPQLAAPITA